jgi:hypothetical protein
LRCTSSARPPTLDGADHLGFGDILGRAVSFTNPEVCGSDIDLPGGWRRVEPDTLEHCAVGNDISEPRNWKDVAARFKAGDMADDGPAYKDNCVVCYDIWMEVRSLDPEGNLTTDTVQLLNEPTTGTRAKATEEACSSILKTHVRNEERGDHRFFPKAAKHAFIEELSALRQRDAACTRFAFNVFARWSFIPGNSYMRGRRTPCARRTATRVLSTGYVPAALTPDRQFVFGVMRGGLAEALAAGIGDLADVHGTSAVALLPEPKQEPQLVPDRPTLIFPPYVEDVHGGCGCPDTTAELSPACRITDVTSVMTWFAVDSRGEHEVHSYLTDVHVEWFTWRKEAWLAKRIRDYLRSSAGTNGKFYWGEREVKSKNLQMAWDCNRANVVDFASAFTGSGGGITPELVRAALDDQPDDDPPIQALVLRRRLIVRYEYACGYGCAEMNSSVTRTYDSKTKKVGSVAYAWEAPRFLTPEECSIRVIGAGMYEPIKDYEPIWTDKFEKALGDVFDFITDIAGELIAQLCKIFPVDVQDICKIAGDILLGFTPAGIVQDIGDVISVVSAAFSDNPADSDSEFGEFFALVHEVVGDNEVIYAVVVAVLIAVLVLL